MLVELSRTAYGYQRHREDDRILRQRLRELAGQRKRFGSPRLHINAQKRKSRQCRLPRDQRSPFAREVGGGRPARGLVRGALK